MTEGANQGLFIIVAIIIFGIFIALSYYLFRDTLSLSLSNIFKDSTETVTNILTGNNTSNNSISHEDWVKDMESKGYEIATDSDFRGNTDGEFQYQGESKKVIIPNTIKGIDITSINKMFEGTDVVAVALNNPNITDMREAFYSTYADSIDLSNFYTKNVEDMSGMFAMSSFEELDLSNFDTSKVTNMQEMFYDSFAKTINLSSFNTSKVTNMYTMFDSSQAYVLDLSTFDISKVTDMGYMFANSSATIGYAKTTVDADRFNNTSYIPSTLRFTTK